MAIPQDSYLQPRWRFNYRFDAVNPSLPYILQCSTFPELHRNSPSARVPLHARQLHPCDLPTSQHLFPHPVQSHLPLTHLGKTLQHAYDVTKIAKPTKITDKEGAYNLCADEREALNPPERLENQHNLSTSSDSEVLRHREDVISQNSKGNSNVWGESADGEVKYFGVNEVNTYNTYRVILSGGTFAKPDNIYVEAISKDGKPGVGGHTVTLLSDLLNKYDVLEKAYARLVQENTQLRLSIADLTNKEKQISKSQVTEGLTKAKQKSTEDVRATVMSKSAGNRDTPVSDLVSDEQLENVPQAVPRSIRSNKTVAEGRRATSNLKNNLEKARSGLRGQRLSQ